MAKLTILGSGSCIINQNNRCSSGYIVENKEVVMVDSGTGSTTNIHDSEYVVEDITAVFSTHRHPDHISDLVPIVQDKVVRSMTSETANELSLFGPEGHKKYVKDRMSHEMAESPQTVSEKFYPLKVEVLESVQDFGELKVETMKTDHGPEGFDCLSLVFETEESSIGFTGDTDYFEGLEEFFQRVDLLVTDCSAPDHLKKEGHMTPTECGKLARKAEVGKLVLSHLYPDCDRHDIVSTAKKEFNGDIVVAEDLMSIKF